MRFDFSCPVCGSWLDRRLGLEDMPASQEYWECSRCGLSTHVSRLLAQPARKELRDAYLVSLRQRADQGKEAQARLRAIAASFSTADHMALSVAVLGIAFLLGRALWLTFERLTSD